MWRGEIKQILTYLILFLFAELDCVDGYNIPISVSSLKAFVSGSKAS
jgi:hypothetical protein